MGQPTIHIGQAPSHTPAPANGASIRIPLNIVTSTTSGVIGYARNPERNPVIVNRTQIVIDGAGATAACTLDIGVATTNILNDTLIDGVSVNAPVGTVYDNISDVGTHGKSRQYLAAGSYITVAVASGDANGLVADVLVDYKVIDGGSPNR